MFAPVRAAMRLEPADPYQACLPARKKRTAKDAAKEAIREAVMTTRRKFMALAGAAGLSAGVSGSAYSQNTVDGWPSRVVRVISPTATGGPSQNFRLYADNLKTTFGQSFVL